MSEPFADASPASPIAPAMPIPAVAPGEAVAAPRELLSDHLTAEQAASIAMAREQIAAFNGTISTLATVFLLWGLPAETILLALVKNMAAVIRREGTRQRRRDLREQVIGRLGQELAVAELGREPS